MAWNNPNYKNEQAQPAQESLAYIDKDTRVLAENNPAIKAKADAMLDIAKNMMDSVEGAGLTTESKTRDGKTTYTDKMVVHVEPLTDKETGEVVKTKEGDIAYKATLSLKHAGTTLTAYVDKDNEVTSMSASKFTRTQGGKSEFHYYKQDEIANAPINKEMKAVAAHFEDKGLVQAKDKGNGYSPLANVAYEANMYFKEVCEKVLNNEGVLVNDAYAKHEQDEYGDRVSLYNHSDNTVVQLGIRNDDGKPYALAINYDLTAKEDENGNLKYFERQEGEKPAKVYINNKDNLMDYVENEAIRDVVAEFKGFDQKEQTKEAGKKKENVERD